MKVKVQTLDAGKGGDIELNDEIFAVEPRAVRHSISRWGVGCACTIRSRW